MKNRPKNSNVVYILELSLRFYIAYYLLDYGIGKLTGQMFNNATNEILNKPMNEVDLFHLTWYWFHRNILLAYFVGICQILSGILLIFNRTVLLGVLLSLPIFINILLIDIYCVGMIELDIRVSLYIISILYFIYFRKMQVMKALREMTMRKSSQISFKKNKFLLFLIPVFWLLFLAGEFLFIKLFKLLF